MNIINVIFVLSVSSCFIHTDVSQGFVFTEGKIEATSTPLIRE